MPEVEWEGHKISEDLAKVIQDRIGKAAEAGKYAAFDDVKADLKAKAAGMFDDIDVKKTKLADMMEQFTTRIAKLNESVPPEKKGGKEESPDMLKSRLEAEYKANTEKAMREVKITAALEQAHAAAMAAKLDEGYADMFQAQLLKTYTPDVIGDAVVFRKGDVIVHTADAKPARPSDIAAELLKAYPKLINNPAPGPNLGGKPSPQGQGNRPLNASEKILHGISQQLKVN